MEEAAPSGSAEVDRYLADAPAEHRARLEQMRAVIRAAVPDATERFSYRMPGYGYPGYDYKGMIAWFALQSGHVGLYVRPPTIAHHRSDLAGYTTTKSAVHLPLDRPVPVRLVQKLVRASARLVRGKGATTDRRSRRRPDPNARSRRR